MPLAMMRKFLQMLSPGTLSKIELCGTSFDETAHLEDQWSSCFAVLQRCCATSLRRLNIGYLNLSFSVDKLLQPLLHFRELQQMCIESFPPLEVRHAQAMAVAWPRLQELRLAGEDWEESTVYDWAFFCSIRSLFKNLEKLSVTVSFEGATLADIPLLPHGLISLCIYSNEFEEDENLGSAQTLRYARLLNRLYPSLAELIVNDMDSELWNFILAFREAGQEDIDRTSLV